MRAAVIVHERLGRWYRQLRPRLSDRPIRWFETRSTGDLDGVLRELAFPVVLIDLGRQALDGLEALSVTVTRAPGARTLVLDPESYEDAAIAARELGATHVCRGFTPPPLVAELIARWIALALRGVDSAGWSRSTFPETSTDPWGWLSDYLGEPVGRADDRPAPRRWPRATIGGIGDSPPGPSSA
jgi:hypothetical protein